MSLLPAMALVSGQAQERLALVLEGQRKRMIQGLHVVGQAGADDSDDEDVISHPPAKDSMQTAGHQIWMKLDTSRSSLLDEALDLI